MSGAELAAADALCRRLLRGHYENFWVSSPLVPRRLRPHFARVYAYCRTVDDLGDESGEPAEAEARLELWSQDLERSLAGRPAVHPVLRALAETVREHGLPAEPFRDLVAANRQDQRVRSYDSWEQLRGYCRLSATPVGRLVLLLFGVRDERLAGLSDRVCTGLQLANFAQDVRRDSARGRTYLLRPEVEELGVHGAVRAMCERAGGLLAAGRELEAALPPRPRLQVALYRLGGEAVLDAVARAGWRTDEVRPVVPNALKARLVARALAQSRGSEGRSAQSLDAV